MNNYTKILTAPVPQTEQADPRQVQNNAGGYVFQIDDWARLERFLILGSDSGTYYAGARKLTIENAACVRRCLDADYAKTIRIIVEISNSNRAPRNDPSVVAMALAASHSNENARRAALYVLRKVCRIPTDLFHFVALVDKLRGWGSGLRKGVGGWYADSDATMLAYHAVKYQQRDGWSHKDVLRLAGSGIDYSKLSPAHHAVLRWIVCGFTGMGERTVKRGEVEKTYPAINLEHLPRLIHGFTAAMLAESPKTTADLIRSHRLTHEMIKNEHKNDPDVWAALLQTMPPKAMIRNLGKMTKVGLLKPFSEGSKVVIARLNDDGYIRHSKLHPIHLLIAQQQYLKGHGDKGSLTWEPDQAIGHALENAFYSAFSNVAPSGANTLIAIDCSGSMEYATSVGISAREAAIAMTMASVRTEPNCHVIGVTTRTFDLNVTRDARLRDLNNSIPREAEATDMSQPFEWLKKRGIYNVDAVIIYSDNETYAGKEHVHTSLADYRRRSGRTTKFIAAGMTATEFSIADPLDIGSLNVVGFDASAPSVIADFVRGGSNADN